MFTYDPEWVHHLLIQKLDQTKGKEFQGLKQLIHQQFGYNHLALHQQIWGCHFPNPVGLAAGFDKDGLAWNWWADFGFGFAELGTVTPQAQPGNPPPRLFRLPQDQGVINRMGFNNQGVAHLQQQLTHDLGLEKRKIPIGINLGKGKNTTLDQAWRDYLYGFQGLKNYGDYFVINVSSPNTANLRDLQAQALLKPIFEALQQENLGQKPLLVKISPDLENQAIINILELVTTYDLAGVIATNTTIARPELKSAYAQEIGGLSGRPLTRRATEVIHLIYQQTQGQLPIIGVGGIFTAEDAWEKITAGACLLQIYTGWVYQGPGIVKKILLDLTEKLTALNLSTISQAVGLAHR
ncbi:quinone-dependent dihydroorotate dehydrogenase [Gloeomargarita lithophora]|uniref:quinone-dependent dihydroorotate dehydrogenase n=1 Tax=Gloeomargarita lithophora TaxID=1188228 RepID=UPI001C12A8DE